MLRCVGLLELAAASNIDQAFFLPLEAMEGRAATVQKITRAIERRERRCRGTVALQAQFSTAKPTGGRTSNSKMQPRKEKASTKLASRVIAVDDWMTASANWGGGVFVAGCEAADFSSWRW